MAESKSSAVEMTPTTKLQSFVGAIKVLLEIIDAPQALDAASSTYSFDQSQHNFFTSAQILHDNITKFTIGVKDAEKLEAMEGLVNMIEKDCANLVWATQTLVVVMKAHKSVSRKLFGHVRDCLEAVMELGNAMLHKNYEGNNINRITGVVWKCCDEIEKAQLDTKAVIIADVKGHMGTIKDALDELEEAAQADEDGDEDDDEDFGDEDDFDDFGSQSLSKEDKKVVPGVTLILKTCGSMCTQVSKFLSSVPLPGPADSASDDAQATIHWMGELLDIMSQLADLADELVQSVYPPQKRDLVTTNCKTISDCMQKVISHLKNSAGRVDEAAVTKLASTIQMFVDKAMEMIKQ
eukprot:TRINITY_DN10745_c0_g1_i1.p1 TRINITY_DN10745_c0_g1~~TRINITY_DN10745_c0_g1_i1.p1  ORF type:complete len:351 (+),score=86.75 TRINITY_DN10745_c0_g1_i1:54-1106(+)